MEKKFDEKTLKNIAEQVSDYMNLPGQKTSIRLWASVGHLANIEMFVFAKIGLSWEEVLKYNPVFNSYGSEEEYNRIKTFIEKESREYFKVRKRFLKLVHSLDKVQGSFANNRSSFKKYT